MKAKIGDTISWAFDNSKYTPERLRGKTFSAPVAVVDEEEKHYCVYAEYGQDQIPFNEAKIVKGKFKHNKERLALRIITSPIKLVFQLLHRILCAFMETYQWVRFGGQEVIYGDDNGKSIVKMMRQNEELIELLKKEEGAG